MSANVVGVATKFTNILAAKAYGRISCTRVQWTNDIKVVFLSTINILRVGLFILIHGLDASLYTLLSLVLYKSSLDVKYDMTG